MNIDFVYENEVEEFKENFESDFYAIIKETMKQLNIQDDIELSVLLIDDEKIHEINKTYRQIDRSTDVISFALEDSDNFFVEGMPRSLGDIFISVDHAKAQANEYGHSLKREMCFLFTHGLLHLLGYDHMNEEDEKIMFKMQDEILNALNISRESLKDSLIEEAFKATKFAYIPYSKFPVGAALKLKNGKIFIGSNIENCAYGSTMCAERNAVYAAYCQGYRKEDFEALAIVGKGVKIISPCGACRQVLAELLLPDMPIYLANEKENVTTSIRELLPRMFIEEDLNV